MPQQSWSNKRERQYEHVKESEEDRGRSAGRAKEIAARTVNKQRASSGEARSSRSSSGSSRSSSGSSRSSSGSSRSSSGSARSKQDLYDEAKRRNIKGRSTMTKTELERALR
ncbi:plasmid stabilization protein [Dactylosporangium sucinum]|uniref:Plasmid stabilization protein n=1 Tax=Dactylosporangium sucinum TaxID=1424081 RepID=A0A917UBV6_9ACTN|nr:plasmid stabilization protein [Dactylosporangium sucinum]GGM79132.1 hypothetical protein GCM10007977_095820 [Dactylosporangium sucinum]